MNKDLFIKKVNKDLFNISDKSLNKDSFNIQMYMYLDKSLYE